VISVAIDASTYVGTVAVFRDGDLLAEAQTAMRGADREGLLPLVSATVDRACAGSRDIRRVVCGAGPGSFTSLRIAGSIAKGLAFGTGCPLFIVPSLALVPAAVNDLAPGTYLAVLDALRGEVFVAGYRVDEAGGLNEVLPVRLVPATEVESIARSTQAVAIGPGQLRDAAPHARGVGRLAALIEEKGPVDLASWEPLDGRKAEAQAKWEAAHRRPRPTR